MWTNNVRITVNNIFSPSLSAVWSSIFILRASKHLSFSFPAPQRIVTSPRVLFGDSEKLRYFSPALCLVFTGNSCRSETNDGFRCLTNFRSYLPTKFTLLNIIQLLQKLTTQVVVMHLIFTLHSSTSKAILTSKQFATYLNLHNVYMLIETDRKVRSGSFHRDLVTLVSCSIFAGM